MGQFAFTDKLMKALESGLTDRNGTIRRQFATTLGLLAKYTSDDVLAGILNRLLQRARDAHGETVTQAIRNATNLNSQVT